MSNKVLSCMYIVRAASDNILTQWPCKEVWRRLWNILISNNMYLSEKNDPFHVFDSELFFLQISWNPRKSDCKRIKHFKIELQKYHW